MNEIFKEFEFQPLFKCGSPQKSPTTVLKFKETFKASNN
jgi:hypothetical protein